MSYCESAPVKIMQLFIDLCWRNDNRDKAPRSTLLPLAHKIYQTHLPAEQLCHKSGRCGTAIRSLWILSQKGRVGSDGWFITCFKLWHLNRFIESRVGKQIYQSVPSNCNRVNRLLHVNVSCNVGVISGSNDEQYLIKFACKLGGILLPSSDDANINQDDTKSHEKLTKALQGNFFHCGQKARAEANVIWKIYWNGFCGLPWKHYSISDSISLSRSRRFSRLVIYFHQSAM